MSSEPGVTYYITVRAVNAVGPGVISEYSLTVNGEIMIAYYYSQLLCRGRRHTVVRSFVCQSVIMPRAELRRYTVIVLSVSQSVSQSVFYKHFSSLAEN